jgi:hypothetical protein
MREICEPLFDVSSVHSIYKKVSPSSFTPSPSAEIKHLALMEPSVHLHRPSPSSLGSMTPSRRSELGGDLTNNRQQRPRRLPVRALSGPRPCWTQRRGVPSPALRWSVSEQPVSTLMSHSWPGQRMIGSAESVIYPAPSSALIKSSDASGRVVGNDLSAAAQLHRRWARRRHGLSLCSRLMLSAPTPGR